MCIKVFQPEPRPRKMKTNISKITDHISKRIVALGYNVYFHISSRSKSRYMEVRLSENRMITIRISDHPADKFNRLGYEFDVHTIAKRKGSIDYLELLDAFKQIVGREAL